MIAETTLALEKEPSQVTIQAVRHQLAIRVSGLVEPPHPSWKPG